jgi:hypothetical protein
MRRKINMEKVYKNTELNLADVYKSFDKLNSKSSKNKWTKSITIIDKNIDKDSKLQKYRNRAFKLVAR